MDVKFFESTTTPLYSASWAPSTTGQYAGTCIFLITLATVTRLLLSAKTLLDIRRWGKQPSESAFTVLRVNTEKAAFEVLVVGLGYLLMLAVMTMNVGYFASVLGGVFLGTLVSGSWGRDVHSEWLPC